MWGGSLRVSRGYILSPAVPGPCSWVHSQTVPPGLTTRGLPSATASATHSSLPAPLRLSLDRACGRQRCAVSHRWCPGVTDASQSTEPSHLWWQQGGGICQEREGKREEREYEGLCQGTVAGPPGCWLGVSSTRSSCFFPAGGKGRAREKGGETWCLVSGREMLIVGPREGAPWHLGNPKLRRFHWKGGWGSSEKRDTSEFPVLLR